MKPRPAVHPQRRAILAISRLVTVALLIVAGVWIVRSRSVDEPPTTARAATCVTASGTVVALGDAAIACAPAFRLQHPIPLLPPAPASASSGSLLVQRGSNANAANDGVGTFRLVCGYSHMNYDDPIVYPNQPGRAHLHVFFGNTLTDANSTSESLRTTGRSTCQGGIANRSAYWIPSVVNGSGQAVLPTLSFVYYKSGYRNIAPNTIKRIPNGLKMLAGNAAASSPQSSEIVLWTCNNGSAGGSLASIPNCRAGDTLQLSIIFPQCWDGVNLDSANHQSHMAYPDFNAGRCPSSHPVPLPVISINIQWDVPAGGVDDWRLSSDMYGTQINGGMSAHADFIEAWDVGIRNTFTDNCVIAARNCEVGLLGDGRELYGP